MNNDLQKKLYEYEVTPPAGTWDKIASALDDSHLSDQFPTTLYNLEANPPATAWEGIKNVLHDVVETPSRVRRIAPFWRYAAAAAVIAALALGSFKIFSGDAAGNLVTADETQPVQTPATSAPESKEDVASATNQPADAADEARNDAALEASKHLYASLDAGEKQRIKRVSEEHFLAVANPISTAAGLNPGNTYREPECAYVSTPSFAFNDDNSPIDMANRYITLMTPDGRIVRISKKLGPLVCCVSGEEEDEDCNNQLKKWREKLASPNAGTSSGNFLELLNLIHNFKENNP